MKGLDLSKFKKLSSDGKSTTLKHPEGHKIIIAHHAVSPAMRKQLDSLPKKYADGGDTEEPVQRFAYAGEVEGGGNPDTGIGANLPEWATTPVSQQLSKAASDQTPQIPRDVAEKSLADPNSPLAKDFPEELQRAGKYYGINQPSAQAAPASIPEQAAPAPEATPAPEAPAAAAEPTAPHVQHAPKAAASMPAAAPAAPAAPAEPAQPPPVAQQLTQEAQAWQQDLQNGHIKPETYHDLFAKRDTLGKIGMLFGMMVSGAGAGLAHQQNAVMQAMDNEINNDLKAQETSKNNAQNFLKIHQQDEMNKAQIKHLGQQGTLMEAQTKGALAEAQLKSWTRSKMIMNYTALHEMATKVAGMAPGPQKDQAQAALTAMSMAADKENTGLADRAQGLAPLYQGITGQGGANGQPNTTAMKMVPELKGVAEDIEQKTVPGFEGRATIPVSQEIKSQLTAQKQYDQKAREYVDFAKQHSGNWANLNLVDRRKVANQGGALAANLQSLYRNKIKGGVYKKGEQEFIEQIIPDQPAKWSASLNAIPKVEQTIRDNQNDIKNTAGSVGLKYGGTSAAGGQSDMVTVIDPSGKRGSIPRANLQKALSRGFKAAQ